MSAPGFEVLRRPAVCIAVLFSFVAGFRAGAIGLVPQGTQTPDTLCKCAGDESASRGGIRSFEEFSQKFGSTFRSRAELELAWKVYQAVNRCDSTVIIGRLSDTGSFENKPGYCVLRTLEGWTMRVNQAFIRGATDRGARIQLVSDMPPEIMTGEDVDINQIGPEDREAKWIVIYNNEIQWVQETGRYRLAYDTRKKITPSDPAYLEPTDHKATTSAAAGELELVGITPDPKCSTWDFYTSCDPKAGRITAKSSWGTANYQWTPPPERIGSAGFAVTLAASEQTPPNAPIATGLNINGGGLDVDPAGATVAIGAPNQPLSKSITVKLKPPKNPSGDYYLKIGVYWGPGFTYHYRVAK